MVDWSLPLTPALIQWSQSWCRQQQLQLMGLPLQQCSLRLLWMATLCMPCLAFLMGCWSHPLRLPFMACPSILLTVQQPSPTPLW